MKKNIKFIFIVLLLFIVSGCKKDSMEDINIYTTVYPIEYITENLYGEYSNINSIYPNEIIELTDKLITNYSESDLFVYNGLSNEKDYAVSMINKNKSIRIVDADMGMEKNYSLEELWLNPSNFLMLALNIRNGMKEYITNSFLRKEIDANYEKIKLDISLLDADIKLLIENANKKDILVSNNTFNFLEKYGLNVISVQKDNEINEKIMSDIKKKIDNKEIKYIIMLEGDEINEDIEIMLSDNNIEKLYFDSLSVLSKENRANGKDYINVMNDNLETLKKELYDD